MPTDTDTNTTPRDKAIERLAVLLAVEGGCTVGYELENPVWRQNAETLLRELGAVFVDDALYEAVRTASDKAYCDGRCDDMGCRGHAREDVGLSDGDLARLALADHVIEQRKGEG